MPQFIPQPHLVNLSSPFGIGLEEPFDEVLELLAALGGIGIETVVEIRELTGQNFSTLPFSSPIILLGASINLSVIHSVHPDPFDKRGDAAHNHVA